MVETAPALPLVFFPGAAGRVEFLRPIAERLARRRPTILCQYPGLGGAPPEPNLRTLDDLLSHLLVSLPERFDLVTMSMGGVLGLLVALEHPARLRKLTLMATSGGVDAQALGALEWRDTLKDLQQDRPAWFLTDRTDVTPRLHEVRHDTLLIFGDDDLIAPLAVGRHLLAHLASARLEVVPGGTHDLEIDFPDLIASFIEAHLRRPA
jgi:pimeloyl-ACP methyl ester carboxylesterase